ncbi:hypothetical protein P0082_06535 [Candidatus Haliotispira prima]|uniref:PilZ domain-containing protein n=1 Tax=Candidatus Haliotispira prima TaxID=3034016 RepID=A0ABY8MG28_9SPIO|nr:hypothetical protein P0082_06535 [Candidatus Haliotispira prima]
MNVLPTIQPNTSAIAFLIVVSCLGAFMIIVLVSRYLNLWQAKRVSAFKFSPKKFRELADSAEFTEDERVFLEGYFRNTQIPRFLEIFYSYRFGQSIMRQVYRATYTHQENFLCDIELARFYIFSMTQKLENFLHKNIFVNSTCKISEGSRFYLDIETEDANDEAENTRFIGKLRSNHRGYFEIQLLNGTPSSVAKGAMVKIELVKDGDHAIYTSRVKGYSSSRKRKKLLVMEHSKKPEIVFGVRRYNRKQLQTSAAIVPLRKDGNKFKAGGEAINALLCDVSMTGCGVLSHVKFPKNSYIGVSYLNPYDNETIKFICEIVDYTKLQNTEVDAVILQTQIEKIDYYDRNLISVFVYEFENENDKVRKLIEDQVSKVSTFDNSTVAVLRGRSQSAIR